MPDTVEALLEEDRAWLARSEQHALALMRRCLGDNLSLGHTEADLEQIQFMLDDKVFDQVDRSYDLPAFAVVLGNVFDARASMKWAAVTNEFGRHVSAPKPRHFVGDGTGPSEHQVRG
jgi:hypothetical protein